MSNNNENKATPSQCATIRKMLEAGRHVTPMDALNECGCFRLGARIWDLKHMGMDIKMRLVSNGNGKKYAEYFI